MEEDMHELAVIERKALSESIEELSVFAEEKLRRLHLSEEKLLQLLMALDEAITNVVMYAYEGAKGMIRLEIGESDDEAVLELIDEGRPFDPMQQSEPKLDVPLEERTAGGMGIAIMRKFADGLKYYRDDGRNHFIIKKRIR
ncbi:MAG: ATP-binding protein [Bacteroidia bacterium]|nr:ATP-binding protein [Bacteroidia bacterium]